MTDIDAIDLDLVIPKSQYAIYEYHFSQADRLDHGIVSSIEANNYFQRSRLKPDQLKVIWNLSDLHGRGYLDRRGFYVGLKLIALAQNNLDFHDYSNITKDIVPPNVGSDIPQSIILSVADMWTIGPTARCTFDRAFEKLSGPMNKIPGSSVKPIFLKSGLSADQLHKIWELSDIDEDGALDRNEFAIAMFLIHGLKSSTIRELPERVPTNLLPIRMRRASGVESGIVLPNLVPNTNILTSITPLQISPSKRTDDNWIVSAEEKQKFDILFQQLDLDKDGFLAGGDVFQTFLASGLPNFVLSHIWNLCDIGQTGKLNAEQFALASYFISLKLKAANYQLPMELSHDMIPPSLRPKTFSINESDNGELQQLLSEVNTLTSEKSLCEIHFNEKQQIVKDKRAELSSLELRSGTVNATLVERQQRMTEKQNEFNDIQNRKEKTIKDIYDIEQQIKEENHLITIAREKINELSVQTDAQQEVRQILNKIKDDKNTIETRLLNKQQQLAQIKLDVERYQHTVESQRALIDEYMKSEQKDSQVAIQELITKFKQLADSPGKSAPSVISKIAFPQQQQTQITSTTSSFQDPFGLPANANNTFNAFGRADDPFSSTRADDPFISATATNQKLDDTDPFRPVDFNAAHELIKKSMASRSKTPGANMFGGHDFSQAVAPSANRPQSATPWEPTRQTPPQPGTQAFNDLFDIFG
ncbi:unnamed protein product [Rotaria sp. Silwood2]|nr:unnamed protein product [Rotaria sp. Silwood2]CAF2828993.1 unnamed protein product [Rotaria sp. Silwood2]CAF2981450.1 unnamed protein product [Rotaria sp. Silwood2]CAF3988487.1 unnamed protein product [Rotaria sp. Silwood2]CAF4099206.1 unnamed protein product [Rotaria sp. Silwood2]